MTTRALKIINKAMDELELAYGFGEYAAVPVVYPYFVGEYSET